MVRSSGTLRLPPEPLAMPGTSTKRTVAGRVLLRLEQLGEPVEAGVGDLRDADVRLALARGGLRRGGR